MLQVSCHIPFSVDIFWEKAVAKKPYRQAPGNSPSTQSHLLRNLGRKLLTLKGAIFGLSDFCRNKLLYFANVLLGKVS